MGYITNDPLKHEKKQSNLSANDQSAVKQPTKRLTFAEYLWLDGHQPIQQLRSKSKVINLPLKPVITDFPIWRFDGSATKQAHNEESECVLKPIRVYRDPFHNDDQGLGDRYLILCEVQDSAGNTHYTNHRARLYSAIRTAGEEITPQFEYQQRYTLLSDTHLSDNNLSDNNLSDNNALDRDSSDRRNRVQPTHHESSSYCGVGHQRVFGRDIAEAHASACIRAGVLLNSTHAEKTPGEWAFQIGNHSNGEQDDPLASTDDVWLSRYLLHRIGEQFGVTILLDVTHSAPPLKVNFSTAFTRDPRCGLSALRVLVNALLPSRNEGTEMNFISQGPYAKESTLTVDHSNGIRIPDSVIQQGHGYLEDWRMHPSNDPYIIGKSLMDAILKLS
ncbi:glutamine synthetase beta-grasp domain-containing protein [Marinibactrum halimedae]|uniref:glutamine synthetase n=1 Tax=Marinibactrum halimedae TaxID=1444977 RepID=A0AA37T3B9_9GAMM|nr:glutamine synthetase beta-grasp domain-containing protein [Marinibactrum halimedae]MCD9461221.1 glutamine synthetase beta-grasp domain-containing protein [Marinibactrum halimedae]GLS24467.1 glutamine synthetase [Marinibactrum halimedae]